MRPGRLWASTSGILSTGFAAVHAFLSAAVPLLVSLLVRTVCPLQLCSSMPTLSSSAHLPCRYADAFARCREFLWIVEHLRCLGSASRE